MKESPITKSMADVERVLDALLSEFPHKITLESGLQILDTAKSVLVLMAVDNNSKIKRPRKECPL